MFASSFHRITVYSHSSLWNSLHSLNPSEIFLGSASLCNGWPDSLNKYWYKMSGIANYINNHNNTCFLLSGQLSYVVLWYDWPVEFILINPACNLDLQLLQAMTSWSQGVEAQWKRVITLTLRLFLKPFTRIGPPTSQNAAAVCQTTRWALNLFCPCCSWPSVLKST